MTNKKNTIQLLAFVSVFTIFLGLSSCKNSDKKKQAPIDIESNGSLKNDDTPPLSYITISGKKRSVPEFSFYNQDSIVITNKDYLGKVYIVDFFFTSCPTICPKMTENLAALQEVFRQNPDFGIASFTINPRYDTPSVLTRYAERYAASHKNWNFLTKDAETTYALAENGFYLIAGEAEDAPGGFEHSGQFALVDKHGYIRSRNDAFGNPIVYYKGTLTKAIADQNNVEWPMNILMEDIQKLLDEE